MLQLNLVKERLMFLSPAVQSGKERELTINDFKIMSGLGTGAFGEVYKVEKISTKVIYALKKISKQKLKSHSLTNQTKMEIKIMYRLAHPNILKIINHFEDDDAVYLVLEYAEGGQLYNSLKEKGSFDEKTALQYMREMVSAIDYCHSRDPPIIHRDIKPENILLGSGGHIKLADFGWSTFLTPTKPRTTYCGTLDYLAPEIIDEAGHGLTLDYWCLGVLAYEFLTGKVPFAPAEGVRDPRLIQLQVTENILKGEVEFPKDFPPQAKDLIAKLLSRDPKQRGTIQEIKQHPWLKSIIATHHNLTDSVVPGGNTEPKISRVQKENTSILTGSSQTVAVTVETKVVPQEKIVTEGAVGRETNKERERKPTEGISPKTLELQWSKSDELFERFSMSVKSGNIEKQEIVEKLEKTVQELRKEIIEVNAKLKMRDDEIKNLKEGTDKNHEVVQAARSSTDAKRIVMLEEQNQKLTKEVDELWIALETKEAKLQNMSRDLKKIDEMKDLIEKSKAEKKTMKAQLKEAQSKIYETNGKVIEIQKDKENEKMKFERMLSFEEASSPTKCVNPEQKKIEQLMQFANSALEEMQEKISMYHGSKESLERIEKELYEKNVEVVKIQSEFQRKLNETKRQLETDYQSQLEQAKEEFKKELEKVEMRHKEVNKTLEEELAVLKTIQFEKEKADIVIEDYKRQISTLTTNNDTLSRICANLQTLKEDNEKKINNLKNEVEDYRIKIRDHLKKAQ